MDFIDHSQLAGHHAFLSASKYHWVNYDFDKLRQTFLSSQAAARGDRLHRLARDMILDGVRAAVPRTGDKSFALYVNDAIGYKMTPEQILVYSVNAFGTADTISFRKNKLRIHDLKTGKTPTKVTQLEIYAAFFCLEYGFKPFEIEMEFRIYRPEEVEVYDGDPVLITEFMDRIVTFDRFIQEWKEV